MTVFADLTVSLEGFVAGPDPSLQEPLGVGGEQLHEWALAASAWRQAHGREGGEAGIDSDLINETISRTGAGIMGRKMYSGGSGGWENDPNPRGWWGDEPPFHHAVFVLTHHAREPLTLADTTFTFVTDGIESALAQAREAAGDKDVAVAGGADVAEQYLRKGLIDELQVHVAPLLLGGGTRLFEDVPGDLEATRIVESPTGAVHLRYRPR